LWLSVCPNSLNPAIRQTSTRGTEVTAVFSGALLWKKKTAPVLGAADANGI
ncbi:MAG: hypothetical protein ACI91J_001939, partial [Yoonia sp.]